MPRKGHLKAALSKHQAAQTQKAKQRAAEEARARRDAAVAAKANGLGSKKKKLKAQAQARAQDDETEDAPGQVQQASSPAAAAAAAPLSAKKQGKQRQVEPFAADDTILLVGEGNFSFALSLLSAPRSHPAALLLATCYDDEATCYEKYPDARGIVQQIRAIAARDDVVQFGVDAGNLQTCKAVVGPTSGPRRRWSKVYFGFPHVGAGHKDEMRNVLANQLLLLRFFISAAPLLTDGAEPRYAKEGVSALASTKKRKRKAGADDAEEEDVEQIPQAQYIDFDDGSSDDGLFQQLQHSTAGTFTPPARAGSVLVTLRNAHPYTLWDVATLGKRLTTVLPSIVASAPPLPKGVRPPKVADAERNGARYRLWRSFEFVPAAWQGYSHRRTIGFVEGISTAHNEDIIRPGPGVGNGKGKDKDKIAKHAGTGECRTWEFGLVRSAK